MAVFGIILVCIFPQLDWIRENADQNNSEYKDCLRSVKSLNFLEGYSQPCQKSKDKNREKPLTILARRFILDVWLKTEYYRLNFLNLQIF